VNNPAESILPLLAIQVIMPETVVLDESNNEAENWNCLSASMLIGGC
jgi:hypothetical protein